MTLFAFRGGQKPLRSGPPHCCFVSLQLFNCTSRKAPSLHDLLHVFHVLVSGLKRSLHAVPACAEPSTGVLRVGVGCIRIVCVHDISLVSLSFLLDSIQLWAGSYFRLPHPAWQQARQDQHGMYV